MKNNIYVFLPVGGSGTRLWPLSTSKNPKFLLDLLNQGETFLQSTFQRASLISQNIYLMTGRTHIKSVQEQLPSLKDENIFIEPCQKESGPAIIYGAFKAYQKNKDAVIVSMPADHYIADIDKFLKVINDAVKYASLTDKLICLGVSPLRPATGYGYISVGKALNAEDNIYYAKSFKEKPHLELAKEFLEEGTYFWNSGIFIFKAKMVIDSIKNTDLDEAELIENISLEREIDPEKWNKLKKIAFDYIVCENEVKKNNILVIKSDFLWDDIGDFQAIKRNAAIKDGFAYIGGSDNILTYASSGVASNSTDKLLVVLGLEDIAVINTDKAILVSSLKKAQSVKNIVGDLSKNEKYNKYI